MSATARRLAFGVAAAAVCVATGAGAQGAPDFPPLTGRVVDAANLLDPPRETALDALLAAHEAKSSDQVVVATVPSLEGRDIADYALRLARRWELGAAGNDNGALLLVAPAERDVRIEVGRGLEGALTDARSGLIVREEMLPAFRDGDYATGIERGTRAVLATIDGEYVAPAAPAARTDASSAFKGWVPFVFLGMIAVPQLLRRVGARRAADGAFPAGFAGLATTLVSGQLLLGLGAAVAVFLIAWLVSRGGGGGGLGGGGGAAVRRRAGPVIGGYGGGFGGGGGGGFSGGGGGFGGGGASGSW